MKLLQLLFFLVPFLSISQYAISVEVQNVKSSEGTISVAVYNTSEGFLKFEYVYMKESCVAKKGSTFLTINNIPEGTYALAVFHDENDNEELDTNWLGIPKEAVGFSNAKMKTFGPPDFEDCALVLDTNKEVVIRIK